MTVLDFSVWCICLLCQIFNIACFYLLPNEVEVLLFTKDINLGTITALSYCCIIAVLEIILSYVSRHVKNYIRSKLVIMVFALVLIHSIYTFVINVF